MALHSSDTVEVYPTALNRRRLKALPKQKVLLFACSTNCVADWQQALWVATRRMHKVMLRMNTSTSTLVIPGTRLMPSSPDLVSGPGTFECQGVLYSSLVGHVAVEERGDGKTLVAVAKDACAAGSTAPIVPQVNDVVTCRVVGVTSRMARLHILCVSNTNLAEAFRATLRKEDVRAREKDRVEMHNSVRPQDIVLARVLGLGESNTGFMVSTAENELGVVVAHGAESKAKLVPVSWTEMQCPITLVKEKRKVAKIIPENLANMAVDS